MDIEKIIGKTVVFSIKGIALCGKTIIKGVNYAIDYQEQKSEEKKRAEILKLYGDNYDKSN